MLAHLPKNIHLQKISYLDVITIFDVSYNTIRLKCYINVSKCLLDILYIAPHEVAGSPILARAIDKFKLILNKIKKINYKFNFSTETLSSSQTQIRVSPFFNCNFSTTSEGIVVFNESDLFVLYPIFVNRFITNHFINIINLVILFLVIQIYINN